jgi:glucarate dehydratase
MRISDFNVVPVAHREPPLRNSWGAHSELAARTVVILTTADGTRGVAETYGDSEVIEGLKNARSLVKGMNPYELRKLRLQLQDEIVFGAIETAIYDLLGKVTGQPVHSLLGGKIRDSVEYTGYLFYKYADSDPNSAAIAPQKVMSPEEIVEMAREFVDTHGFRVLKLKAGVLEPDEELETLRRLAEEFGRNTPLRIDPNGAWSVETATRIVRELREIPIRVQWLEDPVPTMHAHARLKRNVDYPIATNMFVTEFDDIAPAVESEAVDVILSDHHYWGGLTGNLELDRVADTFDLGVGMHSNSHLGISMAAMTHVAAAMPNIRYTCDTHYPYMADDIIEEAPIEFEDGQVAVPDDPGLGVEIDDDELQRMNERYENSETLGYSTVESMASEYASVMDEASTEAWLPNKPIW